MSATLQREAALLRDYNYWRSQTWHTQEMRKKKYMADYGLKRHAHYLTELIQWCKARQIDPRRWIYSRFVNRRWMYPPQLKHLIPSKKIEQKALSEYYALTETPALSQRITTENQYARDATGVYFDANRDIAAMAEALKRRYVWAGSYERCMSEMDTQTFGYHPKSQICAQCPARWECCRRLQAKSRGDVVALRLGQIDLKSFYVAANSPGQRGGYATTH